MKVLIIDDEEKSRKLLKLLLEENCPRISEISSAGNLQEGVRLINEIEPEIVFLDIEMPGYSGIQLFEFFAPEQIKFQVIFTTAYSEYAVKAFKLNAVDYLLKPLRDEQVAAAVDKAIDELGKSQINERLTELRNTLQASKVKKIGLPVSNGVLFVKFEDLILLEADRMYTKVYTSSNGEILVSKPLKFFVDMLSEATEFYKPHRSYLINLKFLKQYVSSDGGYIVMENDKAVSISKDKKDEFLQLMQGV
ncbi:LytTR family DNA-binding domain-containing protein [Ekhidna sp.]|uniref:LytR/AlgR family response regulator transcription factor n=1 Tax=Ekhidna sp. TaxID=2608089 RepID=UPI003297D99F